MFSLINVILSEFRFYTFTKFHYIQQTILQLVEKTIFFVGMLSVVMLANHELTITMFIQVCFWFCVVNSFNETAIRIEGELRLKQQMHICSTKSSYWFISIARLLPLLLDTVLIIVISFIIVTQTGVITGYIPYVDVLIYSMIAFIQYIIFNLYLICIALHYKRIQALLGFIEFFAFFYSGMVMQSGLTIPLFSWMNEILQNDYSNGFSLVIILCIELMILIVTMNYIQKKLRKRGD